MRGTMETWLPPVFVFCLYSTLAPPLQKGSPVFQQCLDMIKYIFKEKETIQRVIYLEGRLQLSLLGALKCYKPR